MRVVIVGATGNVGTSLLEVLADEPSVEEIVAVARRVPERAFPRTRFVQADIVSSAFEPIFTGAAAVVHLAWLIQPGPNESPPYAVNVLGSGRLVTAAAAATL